MPIPANLTRVMLFYNGSNDPPIEAHCTMRDVDSGQITFFAIFSSNYSHISEDIDTAASLAGRVLV